MNTAKIDFSAQELRLINDTAFLLAKRQITEKMYHIFADLVKIYSSQPVHSNFIFPKNCDSITGKISKGENYLGLPYITLDFPRLFEAENIFAFRTMFWWGNFFSFTLLLKGKSLDSYKTTIAKNINALRGQSVYICINESQWHHHFENDNYTPLDELKQITIADLSFFKISRKLELNNISELQQFGSDTYDLFLSILK
jgi:hypothetical protein